jgi:aromatic ring-cleaving dioxygenase
MPKIDPAKWLQITIERTRRREGLTDWYPGTVSPVHIGMYERHFTDSQINRPEVSWHWWDGKSWLSGPNGTPHWRQVGDYPAWRGLTRHFEVGQEVILIRGGRGRTTGPGCERKVRARLNSIDPMGNVLCTLLENDSLATTYPHKAGECGNWSGLSFLSQS